MKLAVFGVGVALVLLCGGAVAGQEGSAERKDIVGTEKKLYSQNNEELVIRDYFQDRKDGFFLDVGCADPKKNSTTYFLEKHLGWSGIGIDALAEYAPKYEEQRPNTRFFSYIVTDHTGGPEKFYRIRGATGLSSTIERTEFMGRELRSDVLEIPTTTLNDLLDEAGVSKIDFMSMDIELGAPKALAGFDIERFNPELVCVEAGGDPEYRQGLMDYFEEHGYERIDRYLANDIVNWYFRPKKD